MWRYKKDRHAIVVNKTEETWKCGLNRRGWNRNFDKAGGFSVEKGRKWFAKKWNS